MDLKTYLDKYDIQVTSFADEIGVNNNTLHNYISGTRKPRIDIALKIEKATRKMVTIDDLYSWWRVKNGK